MIVLRSEIVNILHACQLTKVVVRTILHVVMCEKMHGTDLTVSLKVED